MDINIPLLGFQMVNITLLVVWILLDILALFRLRKEELRAEVEIVWVIVILLIPDWGRWHSSLCVHAEEIESPAGARITRPRTYRGSPMLTSRVAIVRVAYR